jgi:hypothetical protein
MIIRWAYRKFSANHLKYRIMSSPMAAIPVSERKAEVTPMRLPRRRGRSPASQSLDRDLLSLNPGPLNLKEAWADQAGLDRLLLHGRVNSDLEEV